MTDTSVEPAFPDIEELIQDTELGTAEPQDVGSSTTGPRTLHMRMLSSVAVKHSLTSTDAWAHSLYAEQFERLRRVEVSAAGIEKALQSVAAVQVEHEGRLKRVEETVGRIEEMMRHFAEQQEQSSSPSTVSVRRILDLMPDLDEIDENEEEDDVDLNFLTEFRARVGDSD